MHLLLSFHASKCLWNVTYWAFNIIMTRNIFVIVKDPVAQTFCHQGPLNQHKLDDMTSRKYLLYYFTLLLTLLTHTFCVCALYKTGTSCPSVPRLVCGWRYSSHMQTVLSPLIEQHIVWGKKTPMCANHHSIKNKPEAQTVRLQNLIVKKKKIFLSIYNEKKTTQNNKKKKKTSYKRTAVLVFSKIKVSGVAFRGKHNQPP